MWAEGKNSRKHKEITRNMAADFTIRNSALFMASGDAECMQVAESTGMIIKGKTKVIIPEHDEALAQQLDFTLHKIGWVKSSTVHVGEIHDLILPRSLDYAWIDLNGTITNRIAEWLSQELSAKLLPNAIICLTHEYTWRNNEWLKDTRQQILQKKRESYLRYRHQAGVFQDKYITFPAYLISCLLRDWEIEVMEPYRYSDTIDMVFYRFRVVRRQKPVFPLVSFDPLPVGVQKMKTVPTSGQVIDALFKAVKPAEKSHATRKLNAYVASRVKDGKNETQVRAAIAAHVTRRKMASA